MPLSIHLASALSFVPAFHHLNPGFFEPAALAPSSANVDRHRRAAALLRAAAASTAAPNGPATTVRPTDFGADATGQNDTSDAFASALAAMLALRREDRKDASGLYDLGGATLDLSGGIYRISRPIMYPVGYSNFKVARGTLVAAADFPRGAYMVSVGGGNASCAAPPTTGLGKGNCNSLVEVSQLTLDAGRRASGGLLVNHTMDVNVGPAIMVVDYTDVGISLQGSGASFVHHAWLGAVHPGSSVPRPQATGTAILLDEGQHDAMIEDVIIFSGQHGVRSANGANRLQGVHAWNLAGAQGGVGIELGSPWGGPSGGRVQNCYLDYAPLVVRNPGNLLVSGNLFLGSSTIVLAAASHNFAVRDVIITDNVHHTGNAANASYVVDESAGTFGSVTDVVVEGNEVDKADAAKNKTGTRATRSVALAAGVRSAVLDFSQDLLFRVPIDPPSLRCWLYGSHATGLSATRHGQTAHVSLAEPVPSGSTDVRVTCSVDQSQRACAAH